MFFILLASFIVLLLIQIVLMTRRPHNFPPGPFWWPIVGSIPVLKKLSKSLGGQHLALQKLSEKHNTNVLGLKLGNDKVIVVSSYETIKAVLTKDEFIGRPINFFLKLRCMGVRRGITVTDGDLWRTQRNFVVTHLRGLGYGKNRMKDMIRDEVNDILSILEEKDGQEIKIGSILAVSVLNILWALVSNTRLERNDSRLGRLLDLMDKRARAFDLSGGTLNQFPWIRFVAPEKSGYNLIKGLNAKLKELIMEMIDQHLSSWEEGCDSDLIYAFISEMKKGDGSDPDAFTVEQLMMICLDIFIAGSQTTSNTLDFAFMMMIQHPDVQDKVRTCIEKAFEADADIDYLDRSKIPYVEAVLCESGRLNHVVPVIGPRRVMKDTILDNYLIPKETTVLLNIYSIHHDKKYWKDPENFRPERFLDSNGNLINLEQYIPFGLGKRRCLGDILAKNCIFTFFVEIIRHYEIINPGSDKPTGIPLPGITLTPEKYRVKFIRRK